MDLSPIVLFVFNRPEHTRLTVESLLRNPLASESELFIYSDGPRTQRDLAKINEVRSYVKSLAGFKKVTIIEARENRGLATSIISGVGEIIERFGRVIVLEDDIVTSSCFLGYMNEALCYYQDMEQVMHISSYWYPSETSSLPESFFLRTPSPWGWATWARSWDAFSKDAVSLKASFTKDDIYRFNLDGAQDFWEQVRHNLQGKADTWFIFWYASIFSQGGVSLYPSRSFSLNIGHDGTGVHCLTTDAYKVTLREDPISSFSDDCRENAEALSCIQSFHRKHCPSRLQRLLLIVKQRLWKVMKREQA